jgi:hypothetical protein
MFSMQPAGLVFGDIGSDLVLFLRPHLAPVKVAVDLRGWKRPDPIVQIVRSGGRAEGHVDVAAIQVDVYASTWDATYDLAAQVRSWLADSPLHISHIVMARESVGPQVVTDDDGKPRLNMLWNISQRGAART